MTRKIVISGYYGFGNAGDEAVLAGILETFRRTGVEGVVTVLSGDPPETTRLHTVRAVGRNALAQVFSAIRSADLVISGGGSLLQDVTSSRSLIYYLSVLRFAQWLGKKTAVYCQGIGPLTKPRSRKAVARTLRKCDLITVRDEDSRSLLQSIGVDNPIEVCADPSFIVEPERDRAQDVLREQGVTPGGFIGLAPRPWRQAPEQVNKFVAGCLAAARELDVPAVVIPMQETEDLAVAHIMKLPVLGNSGDPRLAKGLISHCGLLVGMRLHALMFAAATGTALLPVVYDPKVRAFAESCESPHLEIESLTAESTFEAICTAWREREAMANAAVSRVADMRASALSGGELVRQVLDRSS